MIESLNVDFDENLRKDEMESNIQEISNEHSL